MLTKKPFDKSDASHDKRKGSTPQIQTLQRKGSTRVVVKCDVGFGNAVYIRGKGASLTWDRGVMLHNIKPDEWIWETDIPFSACEFKVLINDKQYELGENHPLTQGSNLQYVPKF
jgi:hypothetical protein